MRLVANVLLGAAALVVVAQACSLDESGLGPKHTDGGAGTAGSHSINSGSCFPGAKACPDKKGELVCLSTSDPQTGCQNSTNCAPCELPHATAACADKVGCAIGKCDADWSDCNATPGDGCEGYLLNDPSHCGSCTTNCITTHGPGWLCEKGACVENQCTPKTKGNCDADPANGCEIDLVADINNCGFCGNVCNLPHADAGCAATATGNPLAACVVTTCHPGWANCDGNDANGCESSAGSDPSSCGGCGKKCSTTNGVAGCVDGQCGILCNPGWGNCDNNVDNGCETDVDSHVSHCGACGQACSSTNGTPICSGGKCTTGSCAGGYADCNGNPADGCETDTQSDPDHCGSCTGVCPQVANGSATCTAGACGVACSPGYSSCGTTTTCYDTVNDPGHCGTGCAQCPPPSSGSGSPACVGGSCQLSCAGGLTQCGPSCIDLQTSGSNCGQCGKVCTAPAGSSVVCEGGQCKATCNPPLVACNGQCVDTMNDEGHCGGCNNGCRYLAQCQSGICKCPGWAPKECSLACTVNCCSSSDCTSGKICCLGTCCSF